MVTAVPEIFFVASSGGSATHSLAKALNDLSAEIVCFHGKDLFPDRPSFRSPEGEKKLIQKQAHHAAAEGKVVGSVHSIWYGWAREMCIELGGRSAVMVRDPVMRSMSIIRLDFIKARKSHRLEPRVRASHPRGRLVRRILERVAPESLTFDGPHAIVAATRFNFLNVLLQTIFADAMNRIDFPEVEQFRFEDVTSDPAILRDLMISVLPPRFHCLVQEVAELPTIHSRSQDYTDQHLLADLGASDGFVTRAFDEIESVLRRERRLSPFMLYEKFGYDLATTLSRLER